VPFPTIPPIAGVEIATGRAGFYKHDREDLLLMRFAEGTSGGRRLHPPRRRLGPGRLVQAPAGRHRGEDVRALVVNAGCANSFTGRRAPTPCAGWPRPWASASTAASAT
jgi:glutamate N-acetyltransferase/amino-acid N-acetyltransferase